MAGSGDDRTDERSGSGGSEEAEPEEKTDGWLTTYADMVTLLLTFFVLLFAISNVDAQKASLMFAAMSRNGLTAEEFLEINQKFHPSENPDDTMLITPPTPEPPDPDEPDAGNPELDALAEYLQEYINENSLGDSIKIVYNGDTIMLTLANDIWFASGSAEITEGMKDYAKVIAQMIADTHNVERPFEIVVAGHTDNVPIHTVRYPSNWYVSMDRATNFLELLINDSGLDPAYFYARGCGETRPLASNDTAEGRQLNRRVEVMIAPERTENTGLPIVHN